MAEKRFRSYIGDSVYASYDGYHIWLETDNGSGPIHEIALDPGAFDALVSYVDRLNQIRRLDPEL